MPFLWLLWDTYRILDRFFSETAIFDVNSFDRRYNFSYHLALYDLRDMVAVKAGSFTMGSPGSEENRSSGEKEHEVTLSRDFHINRFEVTQALWEEIMGSNPSDSSRGIGPDYPVNMVTWDDAVTFCNKLSQLDGLTPTYSGSESDTHCNFEADGYRLPTEAEWEYAARGGHLAQGYTLYAGGDQLDNLGWYNGNSHYKVLPVGKKTPNALGIYDMSGNMSEWCWDWVADYGGNALDPVGPDMGLLRIKRGGSWYGPEEFCRSANRDSFTTGNRFFDVGFRLVRTTAGF